MAQLITIDVGDGEDGTAVFEVDDDLLPVEPEGFPGGSVAARAQVSLQEALDQLGPALAKIFDTLRRLGPEEAAVDFGLKVGGEAGVVVAKGMAEVNFAVHLVWRRHG
ncbi:MULTISPECIES: CU044_2847 family protein [unclassified Streptomyces]|uniref:CU044_2847 family protein n=1 Tax=unclassified Streptomyces TaxID=2593676 RepID=UPI00332DD85F